MKEISIAIIICTYKRESCVKRNIDFLNRHCRDVIDTVFVIDNGKTLLPSLNNDFIHIIPNNNGGGSGGYRRGMYEASKTNCSHIFLMDDDVEISKQTIHIAVTKLKDFTEKEKNDWIGFGMVSFNNPEILYECGAYWNGITLKSNNKGIIINDINSNIDSGLKYNYSAWWSIIMPISVIKDYGYPLPLFIKHDDVEYGLRRNKNEKIHFYKEVYVKHESFDKKYSPLIEYYATRNSFITNVYHFKHSLFLSLIRYLCKTFKLFFKGNYKGIRMINKGLKDFMVGPSLLRNVNAEDLNNKLKVIIDKKMNKFWFALSAPLSFFVNLTVLFAKYHKVKNKYKNEYCNLINFKKAEVDNIC